MSRMIIKVCGLREKENIRDVEQLDIDMTGFIFYPRSSRYVPLSEQERRTEEYHDVQATGTPVRRHIQRVGVFVNDTPENILLRVRHHQLDYLQLHGDETAAFIEKTKQLLTEEGFGNIRIIKAISIRKKEDIRRWTNYRGMADLLLFDTSCSSYGGSGVSFDWSLLRDYEGDIPFLLSGGIGPEDVHSVLSFHHPMMAGIDLNSRFETAPALKDIDRLRLFIQQVRNPQR